MKKYKVILDEEGCKLCRSGFRYGIIRPDGQQVAFGYERIAATEICELMNSAFAYGKTEKK